MNIHAAPGVARIAIIGLGYAGLPLAVEFGKHFDSLGFDTNAQCIAELVAGNDCINETSADEGAIIYDIMGLFPRDQVDGRL